MILTDAHFSHNTPRNSVLDLPLALLPLSLKTWLCATKSACFGDPRKNDQN